MITGVPKHILTDGLEGNHLCIAQVISWAACQMMMWVEDRAYSLMGLLDVNMLMLYGEGKKAFHRLQLEIIHSSNDQSIFAWGHDFNTVQIGSILADDPSAFEGCSDVKLMNHHELIEEFPKLFSTNADHFDVFPITNHSIQIWMPPRRYRDSDFVFKAYLPCWYGPGFLVSIDLVLWNSNYYRYPSMLNDTLVDSSAEFHQVYLQYQDTPNHTVTFDIDDSGIIENRFTCTHVKPENLTGNTLMLTNTSPLCVKTYSEEQGNGCFKVNFGQCLSLDWVHLDVARNPMSWIEGAWKVQVPGGALSMADAPSQVNSSGCCLWFHHLWLPRSTWIIWIYRIAWERSKIRLRMEVFQSPHFWQHGLDKWNTYDVEVSDFLVHVNYYHDHL